MPGNLQHPYAAMPLLVPSHGIIVHKSHTQIAPSYLITAGQNSNRNKKHNMLVPSQSMI